jgi:hypothetical protein
MVVSFTFLHPSKAPLWWEILWFSWSFKVSGVGSDVGSPCVDVAGCHLRIRRQFRYSFALFLCRGMLGYSVFLVLMFFCLVLMSWLVKIFGVGSDVLSPHVDVGVSRLYKRCWFLCINSDESRSYITINQYMIM